MAAFEFVHARVTWASNPQYFYITLTSEEETRLFIKSGIQSLIDQGKLSKPDIEIHTFLPASDESESDEELEIEVKINLGDFVLAPCRYLDSKDGALFRGQILDVYQDDILGEHFRLRFIDYGPEQWVHMDDVYALTDTLHMPEPLAYKCMIEGLYADSNNRDEWTEEAKSAFKELICTEKPLRVSNHLKPGFDPHCYNYVNLFACPNDSETQDWINVRDHLLLLGFGQLMHPRIAARLPGAQKLMLLQKLMSPKDHLRNKSISIVRISHVENPSLFYVQPLSVIGNQSIILRELQEEMQDILTPEMWKEAKYFKSDYYRVGQLCAYRRDWKMYRVTIERISRERKAMQIRSVDEGWRELCAQADLLPLPADPLINRYPLRMALRVRLFNLEPPEGQENWPEKSTKELFDLSMKKGKKALVLMYTYNIDIGTVAILKENKKKDDLYNVGDLLVDKGLAKESVSLKDLPEDHLPEMMNRKIDEFFRICDLREKT